MKRFFHALWSILKTNLHLKIIAIIFAFIIWSYVMAEENPIRTKTVTDIPIRYEGVDELRAKDLTVELSDMVQTVDVVMEAGQNSHARINANTITATVDLSTINTTGEVEVNVTIECSVSGANLVSSSVQTVDLTVDELMEKEVPVRCELTGEAMEGYYISSVTPMEETVTIRGAKSEIEGVSEVVCQVPVDGISSTVRGSYLLTLLDSDGNQLTVNSLYGSVPSIIVEVEVLMMKTVPVEIPALDELVTNVQTGYEVVGAQVSPETVSIAGDEEALEGIDSVQLEPINANGADRSVLLRTEIQPIDDVTIVSGSTVSVYVQIAEQQTERTFRSLAIQMDNLGDGLTATLNTERTDVTVSGGISTVNDLTSDDIRASVDLSGLEAGTYVLPVRIDSIPNISSSNVSTSVASVTVTIE